MAWNQANSNQADFMKQRNTRSTSLLSKRRQLHFESLEGRQLLATFSVINTSDNGTGSLRAAINNANVSSGADIISFNIPGNGVKTINLASGLPQIYEQVLIDGWSQPGFASAPLIELHGDGAIEYGLQVFNNGTVIRGLVINNFAYTCISFWGASSGKIQGNYLGTNAAGDATVGHTAFANVLVTQGATNNIVGVDGDGVNDALERNVTVGSNQMGIWFDGAGTDQNRVAGNYVGTNSASQPGLGNKWGVFVSAGSQNIVGSNNDGISDSLEGNVITSSMWRGITVKDNGNGGTSQRTTLSRNLVHDNGLTEIDLVEDDITKNDVNDADTGPNSLQNFPLLTSVAWSFSSVTLGGYLSSSPSGNFRIEIFASSTKAANGHGGSELYVGSLNVTTNASGMATFSNTFNVAVPYGWVLTATATDSLGNTSEFGPSVWQDLVLANTFALNSKPGATKTIYLDFDGYTTTGTQWNTNYGLSTITTPVYSEDADPAFSDDEKISIQEIWRRVGEDFLPFDVNVTTQQPLEDDLINSGGGDTRWGTRSAIGGTIQSVLGAPPGNTTGGIAFLNSFGKPNTSPNFVFSAYTATPKNTAETISHEVGHTLGLDHDGQPGISYYPGHGTGKTAWAPIMGSSSNELIQWSKGEYYNASDTEDDLSIITSNNGFDYRTDDYGNTIGTAAPLSVTSGRVLQTGIIERNTDQDLFSFSFAGGNLDLFVQPAATGANLDIQVQLYNSASALIGTFNPLDQLFARVTAAGLTAGTYYLKIDGVGVGTPLANPPSGYTDYGSLGFYAITGELPAPPTPITIVDNGTPGYSETAGTWLNSGLLGYNNSSTRYSPYPNASVKWTANLEPGFYSIAIFKLANTASSVNAQLSVVHDGVTETQTVDLRAASAGFVNLPGVFYFKGLPSEFVRLTQGATVGYLRADAIRFTKVTAPYTIVDNVAPSYAETSGIWLTSGLLGYNNSSSRYSPYANAVATWTPNLAPGYYSIAIFKLANTVSSINARLSVVHNGITETQTVDLRSATAGFVDLPGVFYFQGSPSELVRLTQGTTVGNLRTDALRFTKVGDLIDNGQTGYLETGSWNASGLFGYNNSSTRFNSAPNAAATWTPAIPAGTYKVEFYNVAHATNSTNAKITIVHNGVSDVLTLNLVTSPSGFLDLGNFSFTGAPGEYLKLSQGLTLGTLRADAVRFTKV